MKIVKLFAILAISSALFACKKSSDDTNTAEPTPTSNNSIYFSCKMDGVDFKMQEGLLNNIANGYGRSTSPSNNLSISDFSSYLYNYVNENFAGYSIGSLTHPYNLPDYEEFKTIFIEGPQDYSEDLSDGVSVEFFLDGVDWSSALGTADQTGSVFEITKVEESSRYGVPHILTEATFNCKVYDGNGGVKVITNGTIRCRFENI